ncbi:hypothetical protein [Tychonema sp. LEGE 07203]|uniref:hypothetical protein n=1 Tax=Tychonema sp. LEGE 07203 TaxID=1828671 RepID=UPI00188275C1|nr:hypothetical protein [Tychonema sp. LEGE 07203]MBE9095584.1 hypothetical protein [Tychonema sp. LEGE 07203]
MTQTHNIYKPARTRQSSIARNSTDIRSAGRVPQILTLNNPNNPLLAHPTTAAIARRFSRKASCYTELCGCVRSGDRPFRQKK